jgi:hypothetical protein
VSHSLRTLVTKLNDPTRQGLEAAAGLCLSLTHFDVEIEHWLSKLLDQRDTEMDLALHHFEIDTLRLKEDLERKLGALTTGNTRTPALSPLVLRLMTEAWLCATIDCGDTQIRTGHILVALRTDDQLQTYVREITAELDKVSTADLPARLADLRSKSKESGATASSADPPPIAPPTEAFSFVSYDRRDQEFVFWLAGELRKHHIEVWVDQWSINPGDDWDHAIESSIDRCGTFIVILTPRSSESREVHSEVQAALNRSKRIIPILRETCRIPRRLLTIQHLDFTGPDHQHQTAVKQLVKLLTIPNKADSASLPS